MFTNYPEIEMPKNKSVDYHLLSKVSKYYYEKKLTQQEISEKLSLSRPKISRLLKQAEDIGDRIDGRRRQQAGPNLQEERFMSASVGSLTSKIARRINPWCSVSSPGKDGGQERSRHDI